MLDARWSYAACPLWLGSAGLYRYMIPLSAAPHGVMVRAEGYRNPSPGTFDDTYAVGAALVTDDSLYVNPGHGACRHVQNQLLGQAPRR